MVRRLYSETKWRYTTVAGGQRFSRMTEQFESPNYFSTAHIPSNDVSDFNYVSKLSGKQGFQLKSKKRLFILLSMHSQISLNK